MPTTTAPFVGSGPANGPVILVPPSGIADFFFGGRALPNGQGVMSYMNLNDGKQWAVQKLGESGGWDYDNRALQLQPYVYRSRSAYLSDDWGPLSIKVPFVYYEGTDQGGSGLPIGQQLALIAMAGEQNLTTDNLTALVCKFRRSQNRKLLNLFSPWLWSLEIEFTAKQGWWNDLAASSNTAVTVGGNPTGVTTAFNITYPGTVWCEPSYVFSLFPGNGAPVSQLVLTNTMSGEALTINFTTPLAAGVAWTITMNSATMQVTDQNGKFYDFSGSFPLLYGPSAQVNAFTCKITTVVNTLANTSTLQTQWTNRWML